MKIKETSLRRLSGNILVKCPKCNSCAYLTTLENTSTTGHRLTCPNCAFTHEWNLDKDSWIPVPGKGPTLDFEIDDIALELWLQIHCCGNVLWTYNSEHIEYISEIVDSKLRERKPSPEWGWLNGGLYSRLPKWILSAKNRKDVKKGLDKLRSLLPKNA